MINHFHLNSAGCSQRNTSTKQAPRKDVESEVAKWLTGARDRAGGRKDRATKQIVNVQENEEN